MNSKLVVTALQMALTQRRPSKALLHHSDQGSQYTGSEYQQMLQDNRIQVSMSGRGSYFDNASMESFFGSLKQEFLYRRRYHTRTAAQSDIFFYLDAFYNRRRRHSSLNYLSPVDFERDYFRKALTLSVY